MLALHGNCCASCWASLWDRPSMSVIASRCSCLAMRFSLVLSAIFLRDRTSSQSWVAECLSARTWDWRSRTDSDNKFCELVWLLVSSNLNTASRQDFGVVSLSSRCFALFAAIYVGFVSQPSADLCMPSGISPWNKQRDDRFCTCINKDDNYSVNSIQFQIRK